MFFDRPRDPDESGFHRLVIEFDHEGAQGGRDVLR